MSTLVGPRRLLRSHIATRLRDPVQLLSMMCEYKIVFSIGGYPGIKRPVGSGIEYPRQVNIHRRECLFVEWKGEIPSQLTLIKSKNIVAVVVESV